MVEADVPAGRGLGGADPSEMKGTSKASTCRVRKPVFAVCKAMSAATSMPAAASSTNEKAICVVANTRRRRLVPGVMRRLLLASPNPVGPVDEGSRGTYASRTAAAIARPAPTHKSVSSTVTSSARTEKRAAYRATIETIGCASTTPRIAPAPHNTRLSASSVRRKAPLLAPSAARTASSPSRRTDRARIRLAMFEHAITKTTAAAASSTSRIARAGEVI